MSTTAKRLKEALDIRHMKQTDLVDITGISKSSISTYLSGDYEPKQKNLFALAKALRVDPAWLMGLDVPMEPDKNIVEEAHLLASAKMSKQAMNLLKNFFAIPEEKRELLINMAEALADKEH